MQNCFSQFKVSRDLHNRDFVGDVEQLKLHGEPIGLWNSRQNGSTNVNGAQKKPKLTDNTEELCKLTHYFL